MGGVVLHSHIELHTCIVVMSCADVRSHRFSVCDYVSSHRRLNANIRLLSGDACLNIFVRHMHPYISIIVRRIGLVRTACVSVVAAAAADVVVRSNSVAAS